MERLESYGQGFVVPEGQGCSEDDGSLEGVRIASIDACGEEHTETFGRKRPGFREVFESGGFF